MSSPEFEIGQKVKVIDGSEYLTDFTEEKGEIIGTIPRDSKIPFRVTVFLDGSGPVNFLPEHLERT